MRFNSEILRFEIMSCSEGRFFSGRILKNPRKVFSRRPALFDVWSRALGKVERRGNISAVPEGGSSSPNLSLAEY